MKVRAKRGVCIGVNNHLQAGDSADLDAATVTFLVSIGAVELETEPKAEAEPEKPERKSKITDTKPTPENPGKKEK